jgi:hypothetical protein
MSYLGRDDNHVPSLQARMFIANFASQSPFAIAGEFAPLRA